MESVLKSFVDLLSNPLVLKALLGYWIFSALVGALPSPDRVPLESKVFLFFYGIAFAFLHGLSGNLNRAAIAFKVPGAPASGSGNGG